MYNYRMTCNPPWEVSSGQAIISGCGECLGDHALPDRGAHEPSTFDDYMHRAERVFDSVRAMLREERRRQMHVVLQMDRHVQMPEVGEQWWVLVPEYRHKGKLDAVWLGPYKILGVFNKGENVKLHIPALCDG